MSSNLNDILEVNENQNDNNLVQYQNPYSKALGAFAIIELISSIIMALYIWSTYGSINVGIYYPVKEANPFAIGLGIGVIVQGVIIFIVISALKVMADDIAYIKGLSEKQD